jgi:hypothetical protein
MGRLKERALSVQAEGMSDAGDDPDVGPDLRWLVRVLWGRREGVLVSRSPEPPPAGRAAATYIALPDVRRTRLLIREGPPAAARRALASYNTVRPPATRLARALLGAGLRMGLTQRAFRDRLRIWVPEASPAGQIEALLLTEHVRRLLGRKEDLMDVIGLRRIGPYTKPVLQLFTGRGEPLAYVKVGWNDVTRQLVENEATFLRSHREQPFRSVWIPRHFSSGRWNDLYFSITLPLPGNIRRYQPHSQLPPLEALREIAESSGIVASSFAASSYWQLIRRALSGLLTEGPPQDSDIVRGFADRLEDRYGGVTMLFGRWHGDWAPWNLAWLGRKLVAWDWEHTAEAVPLGFDAVNFLFQSRFAGRQETLGASMAACRHASPAALRGLGVPTMLHPLILSTYLLEMYIRYARSRRAGAGVNERFYPAILGVFGAGVRSEEERGGRFRRP